MPVVWDMLYRYVEYVRTNVLGQIVLSFLLRVVHYAKIETRLETSFIVFRSVRRRLRKGWKFA
jgi:hypothetical protein